LYAMQEQEAFERGFAGQALADLADAKELLPGYFRPHLAEGNVRERLGWSYRRSGDRDNAEQEFSRAVLDYTDAFQALSGAKGADATERAAAVERVRVRQTKCRLLTGDPADAILAKEELARLDCMQASTPLALYNAACLFCIAMSSPGLPVGDRGRYAQRAWVLLGLALLAGGRDGPWERSTTDVELEAMTRERLIAFEAELKVRHPTLVPLSGDQALRIVQESLPVVLADGPAPPHP
jgi:hypothetical protein